MSRRKSFTHALLPVIYGLATVVLWVTAGPADVRAQVETGELQSTADYVYGQTLNFNLHATDPDQLESAVLYFRLGNSPDSYSVDIPDVAGDASFSLDLTQTRLPPYGTITYWWEIESGGSTLRVREQIIRYVDDQFNWRQLNITDDHAGGTITVYWTGDSETLGEQASNIILEMLPEIGGLIPLAHIIPFEVYIYPSTADLGAALKLAGRDHSPGQTHPDLGVALVTVVNPQTAESELRQGLSRSLVDLLLFQAFEQAAADLAPWISQGVAGVVRGERDVRLEDTLASALELEATIPFSVLCSEAPANQDLAAAQSAAMLRYIVDSYGEGAMRSIVASQANGESCAAALRQAVQLSPQQLEAAWLRAARSTEGSRDVAEISVWLILVLAGFGLGGLLLVRSARP